jgi:hypothetical protein
MVRSLGPQDENLVLQAAGALAATGNGAAIDLGSGYAPDSGGNPHLGIVPITAADFADANETYKFKIQDSPDNATFTDRSPDVSVLAADIGKSILIGAFINNRYVRLVRTLGGTTPSVTVGKCYLQPLHND